ncbi:hypothetical protein [Flavobacterium terrigena]|uniref:Uncharacterized protein n=1 Tax=Flavobacterium terrigena TaxID=402734 RepID=A0A1H6WT51_9FLAO|nr:hypothetical protein [Flavobacterium terrigena]SEJ20003.1 hypothetical protein SAMN05660918_2621 [Flavobacterium terrigena]
MKNFFTLLFFCCLFSNCSDDDQATTTTPSSSLATRPDANSSFDDSFKGIYKGIVMGDVSGTVYVDLLNDGEIWAKLRTNNHETYVLQNIPLEIDKNSIPSPLKKFRFANENISFDMKVDELGNNISVSNLMFFSDETSKICLTKERSTSLVKCYSGKFIGDEESGDINFTTDGQSNVKGFSKNLNSASITSVSGYLNATLAIDGKTTPTEDNPNYSYYQLNANLHIGEISGYLEGYKFDGKWMAEGSELGSWNATRIL